MELTTGESDEEDSKALEYNENSDTVLTHFEFLYHSKTLYQLIDLREEIHFTDAKSYLPLSPVLQALNKDRAMALAREKSD